MSADETTRLRALLDGIAMPWKAQPTIVDGDEVECSALVLCPYGDDGDSTTVAEIDMGHDIECDDAHAALIVGAVNALPGLLDAAEQMQLARDIHADYVRTSDENARRGAAALIALTERAERAERERDDLAATLETRNAEHALAVERVRELEAIIAGRTTAPTEADKVAAWSAHLMVVRFGVRWHVYDAEGRPCAWPTAEVFR